MIKLKRPQNWQKITTQIIGSFEVLLMILLSFNCFAQITTSTTTAYSGKAYYGFDIRYVVEEGKQQVHYGLKYATNTEDAFANLSVSGFQGKALKWGVGSAITKYKENVSVSFNPLISYQKKHLYAEAGSLIRLTYYGYNRNKWNNFITIGYKW